MDADRDLQQTLGRFRLCTRCGELYQRKPLPSYPTPQRCPCRRTSDPTWPRHDFNQHLELCRCCHMVPLPSGSRWSVWFCGECKERVLAFNERLGQTMIPIGRHSLMAGVGVAGHDLAVADDQEVDELVRGFAASSLSWLDSLEVLDDFVRRHTSGLARDLGLGSSGSVGLLRWLRRLGEAAKYDPDTFGKERSFIRLVGYYAPAGA